MFRLTLLASLLHGCAVSPPLPPACEPLCTTLVTTCGVSAFPSYLSCTEGCVLWDNQGADLDSYATCAAESDCDPNALIDCEHNYGPGLVSQ
jgi:hypothetical protein